MLNTLEKVKRLEQYLGYGDFLHDPVVDLTITKLLSRETDRMKQLYTRLSSQIRTFERRYSLESEEFSTRYKRGEMGDEMDFIEWASTLDMLTNIKKRLTILEN